jgi:hypothetical protein
MDANYFRYNFDMRPYSTFSGLPLRRIALTISLLAALLAACTPKATLPTADANAAIRQAVAATVAALPTNAPYPTPFPLPSPTPFNLSGLFCEYNFCIGHPKYVSFVDKKAISNPQLPSSFESGELTAYNENPIIVIYLVWLHAPGTTDSQFLLDTILADDLDTRTDSLKAQLINGFNVYYVSIASIISPSLPFGSAASWVCGDRVFAWKVYAPQDGAAQGLLDEALARFRCE